jgi:exopolysaccharide biosynthesis predicted pyruvyltransferase EpsI
VIQRLSETIRSTLEPFARPYSNCALVDFPNHSNVGDHAIWLGGIAWLADAGIQVRYRCDVRSYDRTRLAQSLDDDGVIFVNGGGNLGDLWQNHQRLRETVIRDFPDRPIVQLPQSLHFQSRESLDRTRAVFDAHPNLTLLARDETSLALARREFRARSELCPDMAFYLGALARPRSPECEIFWLRRDDREAVGDAGALSGEGISVGDWLDSRRPLADHARRMLRRFPVRLLTRSAEGRRTVGRLSDATYDWQARRRLRVGCRLLSTGRVVITDRLHAHILSLLLGIPHVILDNNYGKLRRFCDTWNTLSSPLVRWADTPTEALAAARELLGGCDMSMAGAGEAPSEAPSEARGNAH